MGKIKKPPLSEPSGRVHKKHGLPEDYIRFSFKYLETNHPKFHIRGVNSSYFETLLARLKAISGMKLADFRMAVKSLRSHSIDWSKTTEDEFTHLNKQLKQCEPWQFALTSNEHGRVHGILLDETFYIVWFDPEHSLYAKK